MPENHHIIGRPASGEVLFSTFGNDDNSSLWDASTRLGVLCLAMLIGAFGAGMVPLYLTLSQKQLDLFNAVATGLMTGTA